MRQVIGLLLAVGLTGPSAALAQGTTVEPHFVVMVDTSGSMAMSTGAGNNSCAMPHNRLSDAKCVLQHVVNGYGDVTFALGRFNQTCSGTCASAACDDTCGCNCPLAFCDGNAHSGEMLVPLFEDNQNDIITWNDFNCAACTEPRTFPLATQPELHAQGNTPLAGTLRAARLYYQGTDPNFPGS